MANTSFRKGRAFFEMLFITVNAFVAIAKYSEVLANACAGSNLVVGIDAIISVLASARVSKVDA